MWLSTSFVKTYQLSVYYRPTSTIKKSTSMEPAPIVFERVECKTGVEKSCNLDYKFGLTNGNLAAKDK